jgi:hypothetical protein
VVITTIKEESLIDDLIETFDNLDRFKLKLNPTKCSFSVAARQNSGIPRVSKRNRGKSRKDSMVILTMEKSAKLHEVQ